VKQVKEILLKSTHKSHQMVNKPQTKTAVRLDSLSVGGGIVNRYSAIKMAIELTKTESNDKANAAKARCCSL
jgi:hypothetical protein